MTPIGSLLSCRALRPHRTRTHGHLKTCTRLLVSNENFAGTWAINSSCIATSDELPFRSLNRLPEQELDESLSIESRRF